VHYGDALAPQNIPSGSTLFRGKRNGSVISSSFSTSMQKSSSRKRERISAFNRRD
jgi:hypothetical protein